MSEQYFQKVSQSITSLIEDILVPTGSFSQFLRRRRSVGLSDILSPDDRFDIRVIPILPFTLHLKNSDSELLKIQNGDSAETVLIFRSPILATFPFVIACPKTDLITRIQDLEKLSQFFFNNRSIEPFLPKALEEKPELYKNMIQSKAQLKTVSNSPHAERISGAIFSFEYTALYHSGKPLREEKLVQKRTIEWVNGAETLTPKRDL
jgi:hypothetical protein